MNESSIRALIIKDINRTVGCHASPIESGISPGFPDINMVLKGIEMNLEMKFIRGINGRYKVEPTQIGWGKARAGALGIVLWLLYVQQPCEVFITLGCPHTTSGKFKFDRKIWTDCPTGCVVYEGSPDNWPKALFAAAQALAP